MSRVKFGSINGDIVVTVAFEKATESDPTLILLLRVIFTHVTQSLTFISSWYPTFKILQKTIQPLV